jgi:hypothetical protein
MYRISAAASICHKGTELIGIDVENVSVTLFQFRQASGYPILVVTYRRSPTFIFISLIPSNPLNIYNAIQIGSALWVLETSKEDTRYPILLRKYLMPSSFPDTVLSAEIKSERVIKLSPGTYRLYEKHNDLILWRYSKEISVTLQNGYFEVTGPRLFC